MSGFYIGVDGKARKVKGGYIGVDGKARKIKKGYIGVNGVARLCWTSFEVDPVFANNTWEKIALACQLNAVPASWAVGDQKAMTIGGADYVIDIIGKNHDDYTDGTGKAPLTFQLHDCYGTKNTMNSTITNASGWSGSNMRNNHLVTIYNGMPSEVKNNIKSVNKRTYVKAYDPNSELTATADKLFLLSEIEVFGKMNYTIAGEGSQYQYYSRGNSKMKNCNGSVTTWWLRSPAGANGMFCSVFHDGTVNAHNANNSCGVSFAFCF